MKKMREEILNANSRQAPPWLRMRTHSLLLGRLYGLAREDPEVLSGEKSEVRV